MTANFNQIVSLVTANAAANHVAVSPNHIRRSIDSAVGLGHLSASPASVGLYDHAHLTPGGHAYLRLLEAIYSLESIQRQVEANQLIGIGDIRIGRLLTHKQYAAFNRILAQTNGSEPIEIFLLPGATNGQSLAIALAPDEPPAQINFLFHRR